MTNPLLELNEVDENKLYKNGMIIKSGNFCISGSGLFYGIHIPTNSRDEAEKIIQQIKQLKESLMEKCHIISQSDSVERVLENEIKSLKSEIERITNTYGIVKDNHNLKDLKFRLENTLEEAIKRNERLESQNEKYKLAISKFMSLVNLLEDGDPQNEDPMKLFIEADNCLDEIYKEIISEENK